MPNAFKSPFVRHKLNPILTAEHWPYPAHAVFNPAATLLRDGTTLLLCRVEDQRGISHLTAARSPNGVDGWVVDPEPTLAPSPDAHPEELWGLEDARITYLEELKKYAVVYVSFTRNGPGVSIALTKDFKRFERLGLAMQPNDKDAALFPRRFKGNWALVHRPVTDTSADIWISFSPDLRNWGGHQLMLPARRGAWWDANKIGLCCPPIETDRGWLMIYHGVRTTASGSLYRLGMALFDHEDCEVGVARGDSWMFGPEEPYEVVGDVPNVVFPCGVTVREGVVHMYYGGADSCIALATAPVKDLLDWLDDRGNEYIGIAGQPAERHHFNPSEHRGSG